MARDTGPIVKQSRREGVALAFGVLGRVACAKAVAGHRRGVLIVAVCVAAQHLSIPKPEGLAVVHQPVPLAVYHCVAHFIGVQSVDFLCGDAEYFL